MVLRTVRVPPELEAAFARAEEVVSGYFRELAHDPERGTIEVFGERYLLLRAASLSVEFFGVVQELYGPGREREAETFARHILFDLAHAIGKSDAQTFHSKMGLVDPIERLSAGPVHFAHAGWAFVDISSESAPQPNEKFYLLFDHPYSFEADAWLRADKPRSFPTCIMNSGYSSGWCEESFGTKLVASEVLCRAKGDSCCRFIMAHPSRIESAVERYIVREPDLAARMQSYQIPDFFARKRIEDELLRSREELEARVEERTAELLASNERLKREMEERAVVETKLRQAYKLEAIGRLAGGIAHDFNNLMGVVVGRCSMLARRVSGDARSTEDVEEILQAGNRAANLTRQLLAFSRAQVLGREVFEVNGIVRGLRRMLRSMIGEDVELFTQLDPDAGCIEADRGQIEQVLMNLIVNARDAMPSGGAITIETSPADVSNDESATMPELPAGPYSLIRVSDTGAGMDEATLRQAFDPFFTTKPEGEGTGLGLSTVYGIVRQSGGMVYAQSSRGRGTRFTIYLPRVGLPVELPRQSKVEATTSGKETLLLVEDEAQVRSAVRSMLEQYGYSVIEATGPDEAIDAFRRAPEIAAVVTDVVMRGMTGPEMVAIIRAYRPAIKVIYMSGYADTEQLGRLVTEGRDAFLAKPFVADDLAHLLRSLLDS